MLGLDCTRYPSAKAVLVAGYGFVWGYISTPGNPKNITRAKVQEYAAAGIGVPLIFETTAARASQGFNAGVADAHSAVAQQAALGIPADRPIHYAVDFDATGPAVSPYFDGLASVPGEDAAYGGFKVVSWLLDRGMVHDAWQTAAWSRGQRDPRIAVFQRIGTVVVDNIGCDVNESFVADFGQYPLGGNVTADIQVDKVPVISGDQIGRPKLEASYLWTDTYGFGRDTKAATARIEAQLTALAGTLSDDEANVIAAVRAASNGDADAIAQHLAPLLAGMALGRIPEDQFTALVDAVAAEQDRRAAARANTPVPPA